MNKTTTIDGKEVIAIGAPGSIARAQCEGRQEIKPHTQENLDAFYEFLKSTYEELFKNDPEYAYSASKTTPQDLARKMTLGLDSGSANKDGKAINLTCKHFGISNTYKAIRSFLNEK